MKVYVYYHHKIKCVSCFLEEQPKHGSRLTQTIEAVPTEEPITTNWASSQLIEIGEVFACSGSPNQFKRIS